MTREQKLEEALRLCLEQVKSLHPFHRDGECTVYCAIEKARAALAASGSEPPTKGGDASMPKCAAHGMPLPCYACTRQPGDASGNKTRELPAASTPAVPPSVTELRAEPDLLAKLVSIRDHFGARSSVDAREIYDVLDSLIGSERGVQK